VTVLVLIGIVVVAIVGLLIAGALLGLAFKLFWWVLIGLAIGALARLILPGEQRIGILATALYGIGGSLLGGVIARAFHLGSALQFLIAIGVSALLIAVLGGSRRAGRRS
jgi:uncharacterized membrane protein YeaQ/YmgE (transglycosylase-associated protein family)